MDIVMEYTSVVPLKEKLAAAEAREQKLIIALNNLSCQIVQTVHGGILVNAHEPSFCIKCQALTEHRKALEEQK